MRRDAAPRRDGRARSRAARAARRRRRSSSPLAPAPDVVSRRHGEGGGLEGAQSTRDPAAARGALPRLLRDLARRPEPADVGTSCSQTTRRSPQRVAMAEAWEREDAAGVRLTGQTTGAGIRCRSPQAEHVLDPVCDHLARSRATRSRPGEGALRTCTTPSASWKTKSSSSVPSAAIACARIPAGPGQHVVDRRAPGAAAARPRTKSRVERSRTVSAAPVRQWRRARRRKPARARASRGRRASETSRRRYPSRASASTAFGPSQTSPSGRTVVWIAEEGERRDPEPDRRARARGAGAPA